MAFVFVYVHTTAQVMPSMSETAKSILLQAADECTLELATFIGLQQEDGLAVQLEAGVTHELIVPQRAGKTVYLELHVVVHCLAVLAK